MSQATQSLSLTRQLSVRRVLAVAALLALLATAAVVLVVATDGGSTKTSDGRPSAGRVSVPKTAQTSSGPDESRIAASIGSASEASPKVGEIKVSPTIRH